MSITMKKMPPIKIGVIVSRFNQFITEPLWQGAKARLLELGLPESAITQVWVPGAVEIPLMAQTMAQSNRFTALICLGSVIRGETDHYDYVCQQVSAGCQHVALSQKIPVIFGILTTDNETQAFARIGGSEGHKGRESADAAFAMIDVLNSFQASLV
jgi:6,7-dimethyl-8-ribityllumazine synthase